MLVLEKNKTIPYEGPVLNLCVTLYQLLDLLLGKGHSALLRRAELKTLVDLHGNEVLPWLFPAIMDSIWRKKGYINIFHFQAGKGGELTHNETTIISGALDLTQKTAKDVMTPLLRIFSLDLNSKLNAYVIIFFLVNKSVTLVAALLCQLTPFPQWSNEFDHKKRT